jgi:hypothetical protein
LRLTESEELMQVAWPIKRSEAEAYLAAQVDRIIAESLGEWARESRLRKLVEKYGTDDAQAFGRVLITKALDALEKL